VGSLALPAPSRPALGRRSRAWLLVLACAASLSIFVLLRIHTAYALPSFGGACERLRSSGLAVTPRDWFCRSAPWTWQAGAVAGSALVAVGFAAAAAILVAAGRGWLAALPLAPALGAGYPSMLYDATPHWWSGAWPTSGLTTGAITLALLATPAVATAALRRPRSAPPLALSAATGVVAALILAAPLVGLRWIVDSVLSHHFAAVGGLAGQSLALTWAGASVALFGAVLGPDRRWWPSSIVAIAILVAMAPSALLLRGPEHLSDLSRFGGVLPLVTVGLVASAWRPLAEWLSRAATLPGHEAYAPPAPPAATPARRPVRPVVVLNAIAATLVVISVIAFENDPLPVQISAPLPTYLGLRNTVDDVRARMHLETALRAMVSYRALHGTFVGFDAATGHEIEPAVEWVDRIPGVSYSRQDVAIVTAGRDVARLVSASGTGDAFCIRSTPDGVTYGAASGGGDTPPTAGLFERAVHACGSMPWTARAVRPPPWRTMCDDVDDSSYMICRMVQAMVAEELAPPTA
jgi:hypothetical protein